MNVKTRKEIFDSLTRRITESVNSRDISKKKKERLIASANEVLTGFHKQKCFKKVLDSYELDQSSLLSILESKNLLTRDELYKGPVVTLTFSEVVENHVGMQKLGTELDEGLSGDDLEKIAQKAREMGKECEMINLRDVLPPSSKGDGVEDAKVLIIRNGSGELADDIFFEQIDLEWDQKALMRGKVKNKQARFNLCYADFDQEPDYVSKKGRVVSFDSLEYSSSLREVLHELISETSIGGDEPLSLLAEGNFYYLSEICGIGYHGDAERKIVIGCRFGAPMDITWRWYRRSKMVSASSNFTTTLYHGDVYFMSHKATGNDWKKKKIYTLRHSTGCDAYTKKMDKKHLPYLYSPSSSSETMMTKVVVDEDTHVSCVKATCIRKNTSYVNVLEWIRNENNIYTGRQQRVRLKSTTIPFLADGGEWNDYISVDEYGKDSPHGKYYVTFIQGSDDRMLFLRTSKYHNPFSVKEYGIGASLRAYVRYALKNIREGKWDIGEMRDELRGKNLGCYCFQPTDKGFKQKTLTESLESDEWNDEDLLPFKGLTCHAQVLKKIVE